MHKTLYIFPILVKMTLFFPILKAPAPFPKRSVRALPWLQCHWTSAVVSALSNRQNCACEKHYKHNEDRHTAPCVCGNGSVPLSHSGNIVKRIGLHTHSSVIPLFLVDRVLALHAGSRGFYSIGGACPKDFSDPTDQLFSKHNRSVAESQSCEKMKIE